MLWLWDRRDHDWMKSLAWWPGPLISVLMVLPWFIMIQIATQGTYVEGAVGKDLRDNKLARRRGILCDRGVSPVTDYANWPTYYDRKARDRLAEQGREAPRITKSVRQQCSMYMTESHFSNVPQHVYSIIRDPREHIVSAYFHCKESKHHGKKLGHLMPDTLEDWLDAWVKTKRVGKAQALKRMEGYRCYNPINMQSSLLLTLIILNFYKNLLTQ